MIGKQVDLRKIRRLLFDRLDRVGTARELLAYQIDLAEAILETERHLKTGNSGSEVLKSHTKCVRLYADALVWWFLHPHSIRRLAKNLGAPQSLLAQGNAFENVLSHAKGYLEKTGLPILIADITNIIKIGDIIVVVDPERPQIVECKMKVPKWQHLMQSRVGRQVSRAIGTMQYLKEDAAKVFGESYYRVAVKSQHRAERNWEIVDCLCWKALRLGEAFQEISPGDYLWALRSERQEIVLSAVKEKAQGLGTAQFGTSLRLMNFQDGLFPPPPAWRPVSPEVRFQLTEGTIVLFHLVSYEALAGDYGDGQSISIRDGDYPIVVSVRGQEFPLSRRFIYDIVYGFESMESCVKGLLLFGHDLASALPSDFPEVPNRKPSMWYVGATEEISSLLKRDDLSYSDYVSMPRRLVDSFGGPGQPDQSSGGGLAVMTIGDLRKLVAKFALDKSASSS